MAETTKDLYNLSIRNFTQEMDKLDSALQKVNKDSTEYADLLTKKKKLQDGFNDALKTASTDLNGASEKMVNLASSTKKLADSTEQAHSKMKAFNGVMQGVGNLSQALGVNIGGVTKALGVYNTVTQASTVATEAFGLTAKAAWISTGIGAVILGIVSAINFLVDATKKDEEATENMKVIFTIIEPIIDGVSKTINQLVLWLTKLGREFAEKMPSYVKKATSAFAAVIRTVGNVVQAFGNMNKFIGKYMDGFYKVIGQTLSSIVSKFADFANALGLDWLSEQINKFASSLNNLKSPFTYIGDATDTIGKSFNKMADSAEKWGKKMSDNYKEHISLAKEEIRLGKEKINAELANEESLARQSKLRTEIEKTSDPKEKLRLEKELGAEQKANAERQIQLAKDLVTAEERRQKLSPTSFDDKAHLANLQKAVAQAEKEFEKQDLKTQKLLNNTVNSLAKASKAVQDTQNKISKEEYQNLQESIRLIDEKEKHEIFMARKTYQENEALGKSQIIDEVNLTTEINNIQQEAYVKKQKLRIEAFDNEKLQNEELLQITEDAEKDKDKFEEQQLNIKIERYRAFLGILKKESERIDEEMYANQTPFVVGFMADLENEEESFKKTVLDKLPEDIKKEYEELNEIRKQNGETWVEIEEKNNYEIAQRKFEATAQRLDEMEVEGMEVKALRDKLNADSLAEELRHAAALAKIEEDKTKKKKEELDKQLNTTKRVMGKMGSVMTQFGQLEQSLIEDKVARGEISEEEAEAEFERAKKIQVAGAIMSTIAGALDAQMSVWKDESLPLWGKIAMSAMLGMETLMSGYQQVAQIEATTLNSSSKGGGSTKTISTYVPQEITPLVDENRDVNRLQTIDASATASDNRVYILESDIQTSNERVEIRERNSTF